MDTILDIASRRGSTSTERKATEAKAEREADLAFLAREKKRRLNLVPGIPWAKVKKDLGLSGRIAAAGRQANEKA